ncbi:SDR family oxidoreductase [Pseudarthrobacter phenanthrenivorans]|jgi:NAD(P)-dependent dehydrogenase (short-subunit alcohol dehydrogenase family)|uniref:NAD(P)-dependent dehydrogenase (Short-subunit alcohol dehydrogenase family) n=1 Tax=Pseudarthrobacter defluvii TaxID=410837 RepID=A0ABT9UHD6_9MICC|nr:MULTISPECIES: SDR family oxidoreductase [Pseudarthrobacter]MDQ0118373.1 NAD(P)-dependent dehydrogenase (short-subunit alcohol dehydrogenase family) [Pseudarthrobacter defluvii]
MNTAATTGLDLAGKVAVVTGATLRQLGVGIGGATARMMAGRGAKVVVADLEEDAAQALAEEIGAAGGEAIAQRLDLSDPGSIKALFERAVSAYGTVDILHNNAAAVLAKDTTLIDLEIDVWDAMFDINVRGYALASQHAVKLMLQNGGGAIVNTSSVSALGGDITRVAYGACKAAINALTIYTATQYGRQGIRCNAVCPGFTLSASAKGGITDNALEILGRHTLTPYLGTPEHLAEVVTFLASPAAAYITGQIISVDGGLLSHHPQTHDQLVAAGA